MNQKMKDNAISIPTAELEELVESYFDSTISAAGEARLRDFALARLATGKPELSPELDADVRLIASLAAAAGATAGVEVPAALSARWDAAVAEAAACERAARCRTFAFGKMARRWTAAAAAVAVVAIAGWHLVPGGDKAGSPDVMLTAGVLKTEPVAAVKPESSAERQKASAAASEPVRRLAEACSPQRPAQSEPAPPSAGHDADVAEDEEIVFYPATATLPADHDSRYTKVAQAVGTTSGIIDEIGSGSLKDLARISSALEELFTTPLPSEEEEPKFLPI